MIIDALEPLFEEFGDLRYRVADSGEYLSRLPEDVAASEYADQISLLGHRDDIGNVFVSGDVFIYSSYQ